MQDVCIKINDIEYILTEDDYKKFISPVLQIYDIKNNDVRRCVEDILNNCSTTFLTKNNIEVFVKLCLESGLTLEKLNDLTCSTDFKKALTQNITNRNEFNIIDIINKSYKCTIDPSKLFYDPWYADTHCRRGHDRVGEGEVFISFFSKGIKLKKGDITFDCVIPHKIELKGSSGRLLKSQEIVVTQEFKNIFTLQPRNIHTMCVTLCVLSGVLTSEEGMFMFTSQTTFTPAIYNDVYNAITATNALHEYNVLVQRLISSWGKNSKKSPLRAICGAIQIALYKKEKGFDWLLLTKKETPYICKGFLVSDSIVANALTIINNDIVIQQNLDGKGYHISF